MAKHVNEVVYDSATCDIVLRCACGWSTWMTPPVWLDELSKAWSAHLDDAIDAVLGAPKAPKGMYG